MQTSFQAGVDSIYNAVVAKGSTPASKSLSDIIEAIDKISTSSTHTIRARYSINYQPDYNYTYFYLYLDEKQIFYKSAKAIGGFNHSVDVVI